MAPNSHCSITNNDWDRIGQGQNLQRNRTDLYTIKNMSIMNPKPNYLKNEREKNPPINLEEWARYLGLKYIIKLSKEDLVPYQLNLMLNSNQIALFRQTQTLSRHNRVLNRVYSPPCFISQPWQNLNSYRLCTYLILNYQKQISI